MNTLNELLSAPVSDLLGQPVGVIYGGESAEREISLATGQALASALAEGGHQVTLYDFPSDLGAFMQSPPAAVLIAMHSGIGENGTLQGFLETLKMPYSGSGVLATALCMDKVRSKAVLEHFRVPTAPSIPIDRPEHFTADYVTEHMALHQMRFPVVLKPSDSGSSCGVSICKAPSDIQGGLDLIVDLFKKGQASAMLVEQYLSGPEYSVGFFGDVCLGVIEIAPAEQFYDYHAKYHSDQTVYTQLHGELAERIAQVAQKAWHALGCRGVGRVDVMANGDDLYILEANTVPGMTATSLVPKLAQSHGISFARFADLMLATASTDAMTLAGQWS